MRIYTQILTERYNVLRNQRNTLGDALRRERAEAMNAR